MTPLRARRARGCSWVSYLAAKLPPLGDRPHGSHKGQCPLTPHRAKGRGAARKTCSLAGELPPLGDRPRGSPVWCGSLPVGKLIPPFGDEPHGSLKKASVDLKSRWPFALQKYSCHIEASQPARGKPAPRRLREKENQPIHLRCKNSQATPQRPTPQGVSLSTANCGGAERR